MTTRRARTTVVLAAGALLWSVPALAQGQAGQQQSGQQMPGQTKGQQKQPMQGQGQPKQMQGQQGQQAKSGGQATELTVVMPVYEISAGELAANPSMYYGRMVRVRAEVEKALNPHTFTLDEDRIGARPDVLVLNPTPARAPEADNDVTVVGMVRPFVRTEIERDFDWFGAAGDQVSVELQTRPVIVAASVQNEDGDQLVDIDAHNPHRGQMGSEAGSQQGTPQQRSGQQTN